MTTANEQEILNAISCNDGITAKDLSRELCIPKQEINKFLYGRKDVYIDDAYLWRTQKSITKQTEVTDSPTVASELRRATPFKMSEEWPEFVYEERKQIEEFFFDPKNSPFEDDETCSWHLLCCLSDHIKQFTETISDLSSYPRAKRLLKEYQRIYKIYQNSRFEKFKVYLLGDVCEYLGKVGRIDELFDTYDILASLPGYDVLHDNNDDYLSMTYIYHRPVKRGTDIIGTYGLQVNDWGKSHKQEIFNEINNVYKDADNPDLIASFLEDNFEKGWSRYKLDTDYRDYEPIVTKHHLDHYSLGLFFKRPYQIYCRELLRAAENVVRERYGVPKIGEGWVGETELYNLIVKTFKKANVANHYMAEWLGNQHIDVFIRGFNIAIEYQGEQHDKPVKYFGGEDAFQRRLALDQQKVEKCAAHGIPLIHVYPGYDKNELIHLIKRLMASEGKDNRLYIVGKKAQ